MKFIEVDSVFDRKISINVETISDVYQQTDGCRIGMIGHPDNSYTVKQTYEEVMQKISEATDMHR